MSRRKKALGRGLEALFPEDGAGRGKPVEVDVDLIDPNPYQPRRSWSEEELGALAASLEREGMLQPVVVRRRGERYQLIAGERRLRAARKAEMKSVPAIVREADERQLLALALVENMHRRDLGPLEKASALRRLSTEFGLKQEEVAEIVGMSRPAVSNLQRLLELPPEVRRLVAEGKLTMGHGRALLGLTDQKAMVRLGLMAARRGISVHDLEERVRKAGSGETRTGGRKASRRRVDPAVRKLEESLQRSLKTRVRVLGRGGSGKIEISYSSLDELDRILDIIAGRSD
ncbi:ParB/RepB/Spo0J family partition protein [Candidatus Fermentibacteria bacterium]|nr:ParB/RepB/Spo0J family partition protein [Candidatus Fermentibacteria bacterium]